MAARWWTEALIAAGDRLVHDAAQRDRRTLHLHARFIGSRIAFAALVCAAVPAMMFTGWPAHLTAWGAFGALCALMAPALFVSRSGRLADGQDLSTVLVSVCVGAIALVSGGAHSAAPLLLVIVVLDAALAGSRRALVFGAASAAIVAGALLLLPGLHAVTMSLPVVAGVVVAYALVIGWIMVERGERHASSQMRSQARATAALDTVGDAVLWREADGALSFANAGVQRLIGIDRRDLTERALLERVNVGDRPAFLKALADAAAGVARQAVELRISVDRDGRRENGVFDMEARRVDSGPDLAGDGAQAVVIVLRDVTARHAADTLREEARRAAEKAASSKGQFLATMSHELRTPLNAVIGFSELLMHAELIPAGDPRRDEYARIIHSSGQHLLEVVNAILDMSKIESGMMTVEQERIDLPAAIASSASLLAVKAAARNLRIIQEMGPDLPDIVSDRRALKQILLNLLSNAVKFSADGGEVTVTCVRDRDFVEIAVNDTGIGISAEDLAQIGQPFFQARQSYDRQHEGTGLGLSVVRGLIGLLGGAMMIESAPGQGTRIAVRLPILGAVAGSEPVPISTRVRLRRGPLEQILTTEPQTGDEPGARRTA